MSASDSIQGDDDMTCLDEARKSSSSQETAVPTRTLLSKPSAYFKSKIDALRRPSRLMTKTTIHLQPSQEGVGQIPFVPLSRIVYPPKPLVYSPIEPIKPPPTTNKLLHRLSMPLLRSNPSHH
ncbi:hypothetical protein BY458DRAFT_223240 [Sporodiniella umbellata]|nr:hypothetical protein BY458DRAFT_223240 [Sporodiniella umbellata]